MIRFGTLLKIIFSNRKPQISRLISNPFLWSTRFSSNSYSGPKWSEDLWSHTRWPFHSRSTFWLIPLCCYLLWSVHSLMRCLTFHSKPGIDCMFLPHFVLRFNYSWNYLGKNTKYGFHRTILPFFENNKLIRLCLLKTVITSCSFQFFEIKAFIAHFYLILELCYCWIYLIRACFFWFKFCHSNESRKFLSIIENKTAYFNFICSSHVFVHRTLLPFQSMSGVSFQTLESIDVHTGIFLKDTKQLPS